MATASDAEPLSKSLSTAVPALEIDQETDIFLNALSVAYGEDTILLDTVHRSPDGEYEAYLLAVKYGELHETCSSFGAAIAKGRAQIEHLRELRARDTK